MCKHNILFIPVGGAAARLLEISLRTCESRQNYDSFLCLSVSVANRSSHRCGVLVARKMCADRNHLMCVDDKPCPASGEHQSEGPRREIATKASLATGEVEEPEKRQRGGRRPRKKKRGRPKGTTRAAGYGGGRPKGTTVAAGYGGGRPKGMTLAAGYGVGRRGGRTRGTIKPAGWYVQVGTGGPGGPSGRPKGTTRAAGFGVSSGRPKGTTAAAGYGVSPGRPKGTTTSAGYRVGGAALPGSRPGRSIETVPAARCRAYRAGAAAPCPKPGRPPSPATRCSVRARGRQKKWTLAANYLTSPGRQTGSVTAETDSETGNVSSMNSLMSEQLSGRLLGDCVKLHREFVSELQSSVHMFDAEKSSSSSYEITNGKDPVIARQRQLPVATSPSLPNIETTVADYIQTLSYVAALVSVQGDCKIEAGDTPGLLTLGEGILVIGDKDKPSVVAVG